MVPNTPPNVHREFTNLDAIGRWWICGATQQISPTCLIPFNFDAPQHRSTFSRRKNTHEAIRGRYPYSLSWVQMRTVLRNWQPKSRQHSTTTNTKQFQYRQKERGSCNILLSSLHMTGVALLPSFFLSYLKPTDHYSVQSCEVVHFTI